MFICGLLTACDTFKKFMSKVRRKDYTYFLGEREYWTKFIE